jgi:hypothetical protein
MLTRADDSALTNLKASRTDAGIGTQVTQKVDKVERLKREFPRGLEVVESGSPDDRNSLGERPHALFTKKFRVAFAGHEDHFSRQAFRHLVAFFRQHLKS